MIFGVLVAIFVLLCFIYARIYKYTYAAQELLNETLKELKQKNKVDDQ
jgi:Na+/melibiose symporter-like transporter